MIAGAAMKAWVDPHEHMRQVALAAFKSPRWLMPLNLVLQLLFVRLEAELEWSGPQYSVGGIARVAAGKMSVNEFRATHVSIDGPGKYFITGWSLLYGVVPFTGWRRSYRFIGRRARRIRLRGSRRKT